MLVHTSSCATLDDQWQLKKHKGELDYYARQSQVSSLPEFKATITIDAPMDTVMNFMVDFNRHPEWVHGCKQSYVIEFGSYTDAYIYQVTKLPVVKGRDMIMHAETITGDDQQITIRMSAEPNYCEQNSNSDCNKIDDSNYVRVTDAYGQFVLTPIDDDSTQIEWTQFVDPAGGLPHWLIRSTVSQVPIKSLRNLKQILEAKQG